MYISCSRHFALLETSLSSSSGCALLYSAFLRAKCQMFTDPVEELSTCIRIIEAILSEKDSSTILPGDGILRDDRYMVVGCWANA
jgi:hypothetical protein